MRKAVAFVLACLTATVGLAGPAAATHFDLEVEEPAYAGMPVWLDVKVDEPCVEARYQGDLAGNAVGGVAEVTGDGHRTPRGFQPMYYPRSSLMRLPGDCPDARQIRSGGTHRIPLHLVANLLTPGSYAVRWVAPETARLGKLEPTGWLSFKVEPIATARREAWLAGLLHQTPNDPELIRDDYIPSLLAAWPDQRVKHRVLDFLCSDDRTLSNSVLEAFHPALPADDQLYLAQLVRRGCLSDGVVTYVNLSLNMGFLSGQPSELQRERLLAATTMALQEAHAIFLAHAISLALQLKNGRSDGFSPAADAAVLRKVPEVIATPEYRGGSSDDPKSMLVEYVSARNHVRGGLAVLEALAAQQTQAANNAIERLLEEGGPEEVPFLRDRLTGILPEGFGSMSVKEDMETIRKRFGAAATGLLESLTGARTAVIAAAASLALDSEGDRVGTAAALDAFRNGREEEEAELLNQTIGSANCSLEDDTCNRVVSRPAELKEPWAQARKDVAIKYYSKRLAAGL